MLHQPHGVLARHVGILAALQDGHRRTHIDAAAEHQMMLVAILDQSRRIGIGRIGIFRRPLHDAVALQGGLLGLGHALGHQLGGRIHRGGDQHQGLDPGALAAPPQLAGQQQRQPAAERRADDHLRPRGGRKHRERFLEPAAHRAIEEIAARQAIAGVIEAGDGETFFRAERIERRRLGPPHVGAVAVEPENARRSPWPAQHGDAPRGIALAHVQVLKRGFHVHRLHPLCPAFCLALAFAATVCHQTASGCCFLSVPVLTYGRRSTILAAISCRSGNN